MAEEDGNLPLGFKLRHSAAKLLVTEVRASGNNLALANALKELGNIEWRLPRIREDANRSYAEAAEHYLKLGMPLEAAWVIRHIGITQEYAGSLADAERYYDESLELFRKHASDRDANYANTVRYPAVIKNRLGKREDSTLLWEEALKRYEVMGEAAGVAEGAAWLAIFAIEKGDQGLADRWFAKAEVAAAEAKDKDTDKWIDEVRARVKNGPE